MKYTVKNSNKDTLMEYIAPASSKYSSALAILKGYSKEGIEAIIYEEGDAEPITREQCEFMLK